MDTPQHNLPRPIARKLEAVRLTLRAYATVDGVLAVAALLAAAFWVGLAVDWLFELPVLARVMLWTLTLCGCVMLLSTLLIARMLTPISQRTVALLLERSRPELNGALATAVDTSSAGGHGAVAHPVLVSETQRIAEERILSLKPTEVLSFHPLLWKLATAAGCGALILLFAWASPNAFGLWIDRLALSDQPWPRRVALEAVGFETIEGRPTANVARDDAYLLRVRASLTDGHTAPRTVEVRYRYADGRRGRVPMARIGDARAPDDEWQLFTYSFENVSSDIELDILGGDDALRGLRLRVVERPKVVRTTLDLTYPDYLRTTPRSVPFSGRVEAPEGCAATLRVQASKPLLDVAIDDQSAEAPLGYTIESADPSQIAIELPNLTDDHSLLLTLTDRDGVTNRDPYQVFVAVTPDEPPVLTFRAEGIGSAVTPNARLPLTGTIVDDHGVASAWLALAVDAQDAVRRDVPLPDELPESFDGTVAYDLAADESDGEPFAVKVGDKLRLAVAARDAYDLDDEPRTAESAPFVLEVVTPSKLRALLEKRELDLRLRFESLLERTLATRELLDKIGTGDPDTRSENLDALRLSGAGRNTTQLAYETETLADSFEDIVAELVNNRVDTQELLERLRGGIVEPLRDIADERFPKLEQSLQACEQAESAPAGGPLLSRAKRDADAVVDAMRSVLDRMLELEDYNELVDLLRSLLEEQRQLNQSTDTQRKEQLRRLLED